MSHLFLIILFLFFFVSFPGWSFPFFPFFPLFPLSLLKATFAWIAKELPLMSVMSTDSYLYFLQKNKKAKPISAFVWCCIICDLCKYIPLKKNYCNMVSEEGCTYSHVTHSAYRLKYMYIFIDHNILCCVHRFKDLAERWSWKVNEQ